ncbi:MAG: phosphoribosylaminoimidazolesuccinocarboxamide synthase [Candidatus Firestonebacteria bacterium]|nr:phosphoribosylaminoimidazolesuccinocarboxamide synthase [Candidatus Firestonebacteria bacterium]
MGSVKDLEVIKKAEPDSVGTGRFVFSDRYSVFDWGEMPDHIDHKGEAISLLASYFFEKFIQMGIPNHYSGLVENGTVKNLADVKKPVNVMEVKILRVVKPEFKNNNYDYSVYKSLKGCFLIPLEVIYRNFLPPGSSVFKRLSSKEITLKDMGLYEKPYPNQRLEKAVYDVSTKLEITDRYMLWDEAQKISGLSEAELKELKNMTDKVNKIITEEFAKINLVNEDGKIEVGFNPERRLIVVDVAGTLDECRFTPVGNNGIPVSKEIARIHYRNTVWYDAVCEAKQKDIEHWKEICREKPEHLPQKLKILISQIYCACTNEITGREWFQDIPALDDILHEIKENLPSLDIK